MTFVLYKPKLLLTISSSWNRRCRIRRVWSRSEIERWLCPRSQTFMDHGAMGAAAERQTISGFSRAGDSGALVIVAKSPESRIASQQNQNCGWTTLNTDATCG